MGCCNDYDPVLVVSVESESRKVDQKLEEEVWFYAEQCIQ